ncbi:MAG: methylenetetrahydrofolate reductase [Solirubrobacteraceae bacterium]|jgi:methylenetetrahydrofolate reductase (NADPH)|nr:methylenetetrahydrofolate reductase [Solirubrobacteraceae bacterium]
MRIDEILEAAREPVFSFEFFPPKTPEGEVTLRETLATLGPLGPDFVSVTYGAGGTTRARTIEITKWIKQELGIEAMAHLSCVGEPVERLREILDEVGKAGIENVLALRGDPPRGQTEWEPHPDGLEYSTELARMIAADYGYAVGAACFPEVHPEATDLASDLRFLKEKVDAGARFLITQMFFDNDFYFDFVREARAAGIEVPIVAGIMPITNVKQTATITGMCGASLPEGLRAELDRRADDPEAVLQFGVAYATEQCADLLRGGAPGIHFYTLNRSPATRAILSALRLHRPWVRGEAPAAL